VHGNHPILARKDDHLRLCAEGDVGFAAKTTLFDDVELVHDALADVDLDRVDLAAAVAGKKLGAPIFIAGMTGGTERAAELNRALAAAAERHGIGFAVGSQRPMLDALAPGYVVRDVAPTTLIMGNLGVVQARSTSGPRMRALVTDIGADALCLHLNPAQEAVQLGGDRDFRGGLDTVRRVVEEVGVPVIVKETGCGISRAVAERLVTTGIAAIDVGGAGGTSWVRVESLRAEDPGRRLGETFRDWGIPTAAAVDALRGLPIPVLATGGIATGLDVAKALALGAAACGIARPMLKAAIDGTLDAAIARLVEELRVACLLAGVQRAADLARVPVVRGGRLERWTRALV
jgi:isopentenyl-diphosphate delta-isomerase